MEKSQFEVHPSHDFCAYIMIFNVLCVLFQIRTLMRSLYNFLFFSSLYILFSANCFSQANTELVLVGSYNGSNLYIQNPHDGKGVFCIKNISVNDKKITPPSLTAFDIDLSWLKQGQPVVVKIEHGKTCEPKVINPHVLKPSQNFGFVSLSVTAGKIIWLTKGEKPAGQFFVQRQKNQSWEDVKLVLGKGNSQSNLYNEPVEHRKGKNIYRLRYLDVTGKYYNSDNAEFTSEENEIAFFPKRVTSKLNFTEKTDYEILDENKKVIKKGNGISVDCSDLEAGAYIVRFADKEDRFYKK